MDRAPLTALLAVTGLQFARDMKLQQVQLKQDGRKRHQVELSLPENWQRR